MKTRSEVSQEKLRGGFYTPPRLVAHAVERLEQLTVSSKKLRVLEPSVGDGAFLDGLNAIADNVLEVVGIEILESEALKARARLASSDLNGRITNASTLDWALGQCGPTFDAVVGNLPFVRFQFVSSDDRRDAQKHGMELGVDVGGVSNLWLPMLLASLRLLNAGGAFVLVLPAECMTGVSAGPVRRWLLRHFEELRCDIYPAGSFPGALQEIVLLSGRKSASAVNSPSLQMAVHQHLHSDDDFADSLASVATHSVSQSTLAWTRYLLSPSHVEAFEEFQSLPAIRPLSTLARFEVATVTGANAFFSLTENDVKNFNLESWARPLLPRARFAPGLIFSTDDHELAARNGASAYLFDASLAATDRSEHEGLDAFLALGEEQGLHERYKCRIRNPWWAVPSIKDSDLFLSKRSHRYPRMIANETEAVTTDTIYRGHIINSCVGARSLVAGFHNSGTLLSAELEGRNFGGGVLELVPSEVARLSVPAIPSLFRESDKLDRISRDAASLGRSDWNDALRYETDLLVQKADVGVTSSMIDAMSDARALLMGRRLDRNGVFRDAAPLELA